MADDLLASLRRVRAFVSDVDGCLTDGTIYYAEDGTELKGFSVLDGLGFNVAREAGLLLAWISGRRSPMVERRSGELGVHMLFQRTTDKDWALREFARHHELPLEEIAYLGDDLNDLPALHIAGLPMTVPGAPSEVAALARFTTTRAGGHGAARECLEAILRAQGKWEPTVSKWLELLRERQVRETQ